MKEVLEKSKCTGCTACYNSCPRQAIKMEVDKEGFKRPVIIADKCVNCKKCQKVCPVINSEKNEGVGNIIKTNFAEVNNIYSVESGNTIDYNHGPTIAYNTGK